MGVGGEPKVEIDAKAQDERGEQTQPNDASDHLFGLFEDPAEDAHKRGEAKPTPRGDEILLAAKDADRGEVGNQNADRIGEQKEAHLQMIARGDLGSAFEEDPMGPVMEFFDFLEDVLHKKSLADHAKP